MGYIADQLTKGVALPTPQDTLGDSLRKGWSSSVDSLGANVNQIVGLGAEAAGADSFAKNRYAAAQGLREDAERNAPQISSLSQVDGVGNALRWGAGQIGGLGPIALGVGGATIATGNPLVGGALAMGLPEAGDIAHRQTLDPQARVQSAGSRLGQALGGGALSGVVQAAGPGMLLGKATSGAGAELLKRGTKQIIGENLLHGVGVNAGAAAGSEAIKQFATNQDADFDTHAIGETALAGGVMGVPFGALGAGVDLAKATPGKSWIGAKNAVQGGVENARGALNSAGEALGSAKEAAAPAWEAVRGHVDAGLAAAQTGAKDAWAAMPEGLKGVGEFVKTGVEDQVASAVTAYKNIMSDANVPEALKAQAQEWKSNLANNANRVYLWSADKMRSAGEKAKAAVPEDVVSKLREFSKPAGDMLDTILNSESMADTKEFVGKNLDQAKEMLKARKEQASEWLGPKMDELMDRADVSDERKQQIADLRDNISDTASQAKAATVLKAQQLADAAKPKLDAAYKKVGEAYQKLFPDDPSVKKSDDHSGMNALIFDKIGPMIKEAKPELLEDPDSTMKLGSTLRMFMQAAAEGKDLRVAGIHTEMVDLLGPDLAHDVLNAAHEFATGGDQQKQANYFKHLTDSVKSKTDLDGLETTITKNLSNEAPQRTGVTDNPRELAKYLRSWARGEFAAGKPKERVAFEDQEVQKFLEEHFGTNAQKIRDALQKDVESRKDTVLTGNEDGMSEKEIGGVKYVGGGKRGDTALSKPFVGQDSYGGTSASRRVMEDIESKDRSRRAKFVTVSEDASLFDKIPAFKSFVTKTTKAMQATYPKLLLEAEAALESHPDNYAEGMTPKNLADGWLREDTHKAIEAKKKDMREKGNGLVQVTGLDDANRISKDDIDSMRMDTAHSGNKENPARLEVVGENGADHVFDATHVTGTQMKRINRERSWTADDDKSELRRIARAFMEGVGSLMEEYGPIDVPDATVVWRKGEKEVTFAELKADNKGVKSSKSVDTQGRETWFKRDMSPSEVIEADGGDALNELNYLQKQHQFVKSDLEYVREEIKNLTADWEESGQKGKPRDLRQAERELTSLQRQLGRVENSIEHMEKTIERQASAERFTKGKTEEGKQSADADGNIHHAVAELGDNGVAHRVNMDGTMVGSSVGNKHGKEAWNFVGSASRARKQEALAAAKEARTPRAAATDRSSTIQKNPVRFDQEGNAVGHLSEGRPDPKQVAAKKAAASSTDQTTVNYAVERLPTHLKEFADDVRLVDSLHGSWAASANFTGSGYIELRRSRLNHPWGGYTAEQSRNIRLAHEAGHIADYRHGFNLSHALRVYGWLDYFRSEYTAMALNDPLRVWFNMVYDKEYAEGDTSRAMELWSQLTAMHAVFPETLKSRFPEAYEQVEINYANAGNTDQGRSGEGADSGVLGRGESRGREEFSRRPTSQDAASAKARLIEAARANDPALLKELSTSDDAKGLQRAAEDLASAHPESEALQAANKRLGELVQDPDTAYGMQTKKYSLISSVIHADLGKPGFAATHDSPLKHAGDFDWRKHSGKGEGNAAFGAGTYLSTAEGVHRSYKEAFTEDIDGRYDPATKAKRDGLLDLIGQMEDYLSTSSYAYERAKQLADPTKWKKRDEASYVSTGREAYIDKYPEGWANTHSEFDVPIGEYYKTFEEAVRGNFDGDSLNELKATYEADKERLGGVREELSAIEAQATQARGITNEKSPTYHVSVDIPKEQLLDWGKPLGEQSEFVRKAIRRIADDDPLMLASIHPDDLGGKAYSVIARTLRSQAAASEYLQSLGVLGHKYAASGGRNDAHPNYVIYDDSKITTNYVHFDKQTAGGTPLTAKDRKQILDYLNRATPWVQAEFPFLSHVGEFTKEFGQAIVRVSTHALNPTSVAYHESLHAFFQHLKENSGKDISQVVMDAASSPAVTSQLRKLLAHSPEALKQLGNAEERAAYMYQFWADGKLTLGEKPTTLFQKITAGLRKVLGIWSNDERALQIMEYFHSGEYAQNAGKQSAVRTALMEKGRNTAVDKAREMGSKFMEVGDALWGAGSARLRDSKSDALHELADLMKRRGTDQGEDRGYIPAARLKRTEFITQLAEGLAGADETVMHEALEALQSGTKPTSLEARKAHASVRKVLDDMFDYLHQSGVDTRDLGYGKDYFPRHWDSNYLSKHEAEFMDMARKYPQWADAKDTYNKLLANDGSELRVADRPGMQANKRRVLSFIKDADAAPFMSKNLPEIMNGYITQATRRGEWARRFGDDNAKMGELLKRAHTEGASRAEIAHAQDFVAGVNGTLGDTLNPTLRRYMGNMIVYQNIRLLPLAIFSSIVDPMGVMVRGGTVGDAWSTFKRGIREIPAGLKGQQITDHWTGMAQALGTIDNATLQHALGSLYTQGMVGGTAKKINDTFFKYNLMEQFNQSMRVGATEAAVGFITKHADGKASQHSIRWIAELGLRGGDVKVSNGRMATTVAEGLTEAQAARVKSAVNAWVDGAVLRPDAADKPTWMNDPHYMLFSHLKQFVYAFHHTILDRVMHEAKHQNYAPMIALSSYVPTMIAADMLKGLIQGGGSEPDWKKAWGPGEYLENGVERAGLFGVGQFGVDALKGNFGSLSGPTLGQFAEGFEVLDGAKQFKPFAIHSLPANQLYAGALHAGVEDPKFAE